jgi:hypothetical protein
MMTNISTLTGVCTLADRAGSSLYGPPELKRRLRPSFTRERCRGFDQIRSTNRCVSGVRPFEAQLVRLGGITQKNYD